MKHLLFTLAGALTLGAALPAVAGPDFQVIEQARIRHAAQRAAEASTSAPRSLVLPLDHGPRAQTTPWLNKQRVLRAEAQARSAMAATSEIAAMDQPKDR